MNKLFDFNIEECNIKVKLAFGYTPKIFQNHFETRQYSGLLFVERGTYIYSFEGGGFTAEAGSLIYLPPLCKPYTYQIVIPEKTDAKTMQIEFDLKDADDTSVAYNENPMLISTDANSLRSDFLSVISAFVEKESSSGLRLYSSMYNLLASCSEIYENNNSQDIQRRLAPVFAYIQENYNKPISVEELASICHLSQSQLRRLFNKLTGKSPIAYKSELLLDSAKRLLKYGELGVGEIAETLRFYDIYAFSHFFSSAVGVSPSEYRRSRRK